MSDALDPLARIAAALERLARPPVETTDWLAAPAYVWTGALARAVPELEAPQLDQLRAIERQKALVVANVARLAKGAAAHDMLLWGARGTGKSALVRAAAMAAQEQSPRRLALVQLVPDALPTLPALFAQLAAQDRNYLVYIDDLGFAENDPAGARILRSALEGGVEARPANIRLAVTSNRRAIIPRHTAEQDDPLNPRDAVDDALALSDRFGLSLGFHAFSQNDYLAIVGAYAEPLGLAWSEGEALEWARRRGAHSGRTAWQFVNELAGRAGRRL